MNSNSLVIKQKQITNNISIYIYIYIYIYIIVGLSFLCCMTDIKIPWIYPSQ